MGKPSQCHDWYLKNKEHKRAYNKAWREQRKLDPNFLRWEATKKALKIYNLTLEEYNGLFQKFDFKCGICAGTEKLCVDHDHVTNKIRGILCGECNFGLGKFKDNVELLKQAVRYLGE